VAHSAAERQRACRFTRYRSTSLVHMPPARAGKNTHTKTQSHEGDRSCRHPLTPSSFHPFSPHQATPGIADRADWCASDEDSTSADSWNHQVSPALYGSARLYLLEWGKFTKNRANSLHLYVNECHEQGSKIGPRADRW